jgi:hypothetical protein
MDIDLYQVASGFHDASIPRELAGHCWELEHAVHGRQLVMVDTQLLHATVMGDANIRRGLEGAAADLGISTEGVAFHNAGNDAKVTSLVLCAILHAAEA